MIILYALDEPSGSASPVLESFARANLGAVVAQLRKNRDAVQGQRRDKHLRDSLGDKKMTTVAVIGLGYVGLPLVVAFGTQMRTIGFDISPAKVASMPARD